MTSRPALVRPPGPRLADGLVTHIDRSPVDVQLATLQWRSYLAALEAHGWQPVEVPGAPDCPDAVFVEDTMVVYRDVALLARPGAESRRPEVAGPPMPYEPSAIASWTYAPPERSTVAMC